MRTVLILEDVAFVARHLANTMRRAGWSVVMAGSVEQALAATRLFAIDLVIADVMLRDGSGVDAVAELVGARPGVPAIYVSEYARWRVARWLPASGRYTFVPLPAPPAVLVDAANALGPDPPALARSA